MIDLALQREVQRTELQRASQDVAAALTRLLPPPIVTRAAVIRDHVADLLPEEFAQVRRAVPKRRWEYATARVLARQAMAELEFAAAPILNHAVHRYPSWPAGLVGSISHSGSVCCVALGAAERHLAIGLDIESGECPAELRSSVCTESELAWIATWPEPRQAQLLRLLFSAKESFFKCCSRLLQPFRVLDFQCADLRVDLANGTFVVRADGVFAGTATFEGRFVELPSFVATAMSLERASFAHQADAARA